MQPVCILGPMTRPFRPERYDAGLVAALSAVGGPTQLARRLGLVPSAVTQWHRVPYRRVAAVAQATGIPPAVLRPDLARLFGDVASAEHRPHAARAA